MEENPSSLKEYKETIEIATNILKIGVSLRPSFRMIFLKLSIHFKEIDNLLKKDIIMEIKDKNIDMYEIINKFSYYINTNRALLIYYFSANNSSENVDYKKFVSFIKETNNYKSFKAIISETTKNKNLIDEKLIKND